MDFKRGIITILFGYLIIYVYEKIKKDLHNFMILNLFYSEEDAERKLNYTDMYFIVFGYGLINMVL